MNRTGLEERGSVFRMAYDVLMVTSAQFWIVAAAPFYIGWFLSTRTVWPDWQAVLGLVIVGPMIAGSTLAYNAYTDSRVDLFNPRKAHLAYVTGWISPEVVLNLARGLAFAGLVLSLLLGWQFTVLVATGGVTLQNAGELIQAGAAAISAAGELVDKKALAEKKYSIIGENAKKFVAEVKKARGGKS